MFYMHILRRIRPEAARNRSIDLRVTDIIQLEVWSDPTEQSQFASYCPMGRTGAKP